MKHPPQEPDLVRGPMIFGVGVGVVVATIVGVLVAAGLERCRARELGGERYLGEQPGTGSDVGMVRTRLFTVEAQGLDEHARAAARLRSYGWTDRARGIVHIPIDAAATLYLERRARRGEP